MPRISRRIDAARKVLEKSGDRAAATLHDPRRGPHATRAESTRGTSFGTYIGSMVYGGLDGIITTFAVVSGVAGADLGANVILILGVGNLLADGFSMGVGDYLSTKSEREYYAREARRQAWEIDRFPEGQKVELRTLYARNGYSEEEADQLVAVQTRTKPRWVNAMMTEQLGMLKEEANPLHNAIATFISFVLAGSLPLLVYLIGLATPIAPDTAFRISILLSALALFGLGTAKVFVTRLNPLRSGFEMLVVGGLAAVVAYVIGSLLKNVT
ncbi:MAG: putative rane protein [Geminicoccaceae bacterium]|jgi:VIT1/CCC1 family predicted Fe2+/Mn2+ transporter|nr:putative rane protein [Geminicoccaceae bacterium]